MTNEKNSGAVTIFHVARNPDGSIQPIVAAPICPTDLSLIKALLNTDDLGLDEASRYNRDFYYFLYDKQASKPYPSVMIIKFMQTEDGKMYLDMKQEDMQAVAYVIDNYLR